MAAIPMAKSFFVNFLIAFLICDRGKTIWKKEMGRFRAEKERKKQKKQYITVDNSFALLYTVYRKGETGKICILF